MDYKPLLAISSKGQFEEFHDKDDIVEIGSVYFNTKTNKIVGFIEEKQDTVTTKDEVISATTAMSIDPLCEKYYWISPYAYCLNNPLKFIDPDGLDVWEIDDKGQIVKRITKEHDAFYRVDSDGNRRTDAEGNPMSIVFDYGTITRTVKDKPLNNVRDSKKEEIKDVKMSLFEVKGDDNATKLFEFLSTPTDGTNSTVEWTHAKIGTENSGRNVVGTTHRKEFTAVGGYLLREGYSLREVNHNHPDNLNYTSPSDESTAKRYQDRSPGVKLHIYTHPSNYLLYNHSGMPKSKQ